MNERIKKLLEQSTKLDCWYKGESVSIVDYKMFAELIVQECADICMEMSAKCAGLPGDGALAKDCAYWIKKDFGVNNE